MQHLSRRENCLIYNALTSNDYPHDDEQILLLQQFRSRAGDSVVTNYYARSTVLCQLISMYQAGTKEFWAHLLSTQVTPILAAIKKGRDDKALSAIDNMLSDLEKKYNVPVASNADH